MAAIDALLKLVLEQNANELRMGTDRPPAMFRDGQQKRLTMREMSGDELRAVLGKVVLSDEREMLVRRDGQLEFSYGAQEGGIFHVVMTRRGPAVADEPIAFDAVFYHGPRTASQPEHAPSQRPAPRESQPVFAPASAPALAVPTTLAQGHAPIFAEPGPALAPAGERGWRAESEQPRAAGGVDGVMVLTPLLRALLQRASAARASDLHLAAGELPFVRVDGRLAPLDDEPIAALEPLLDGCLGPQALARLAAGKSIDLSGVAPGIGRFRLNVFRASGTLAAAVRLLSAQPPALAELALPVALDELVELPHGLVIVCGPTGVGKSTTLAALAQEALRRRSIMLLSLEDPIEYALSSRGRGSLVRQRQVGRDVASFADGLRDALREDPDVLLIGEMRDPETIALALTAAETGHLVLTSLHSRSAASAVERIVDACPEAKQHYVRAQLADSLRAVVAQRLLPRAKGSGRIAALEVLRVNHAVASMVRDGKTAQIPSAIQSGRREGMLSLERCLMEMVRAGHISEAAARAAANDPAALALS